MHKKYIVRLSEEERQSCLDVVKKLKGSSQQVKRAQLLVVSQFEKNPPNIIPAPAGIQPKSRLWR